MCAHIYVPRVARCGVCVYSVTQCRGVTCACGCALDPGIGSASCLHISRAHLSLTLSGVISELRRQGNLPAHVFRVGTRLLYTAVAWWTGLRRMYYTLPRAVAACDRGAAWRRRAPDSSNLGEGRSRATARALQSLGGLVDLGRDVRGAAPIGVIEHHDLAVRVLDLLLIAALADAQYLRGLVS